MKKTLLALSLLATSGSVFANASAQTEGVELRTSQEIPQICQIQGISSTGEGIGFANGFEGTPTSINVFSNVGTGTAFAVSFSNSNIYFDGINGRQTLPSVSNTISDDYLWVARSEQDAQAFNSEGSSQIIASQEGQGTTTIEFYPELRKSKAEMPAGTIHASATVTITCTAL